MTLNSVSIFGRIILSNNRIRIVGIFQQSIRSNEWLEKDWQMITTEMISSSFNEDCAQL